MASGDVLQSALDHLADLTLKGKDISSGLAVQAVELELQKQRNYLSPTWNATTAQQFEQLIDEIFLKLQPTNDDYLMRCDVVKRVSSVLGSVDILRGFVVLPFGSFQSNLYSRWGDLDLSVELPENGSLNAVGKAEKARILKLVKRILIKRGETRRVQLIPRARVPLLSFEDTYSNVSCDLSIDNGFAFLKSRLLGWISEMDPRCRSLIFLVKCWAKAHCINDPKAGTLNSYALCLLVIFHLQTREKAILPPLNAIVQGDIASTLSGQSRSFRQQILEECWEKIQIFVKKGFGTDNKSSVAELFVSFFCQFSSVSDLWLEGLAVCPFTGTWADRMTLNKWEKKYYMMIVEDPFDRSENCARSVQEFGFFAIRHAFSSTLQAIYHPPADECLPSLREILFCWPAANPRPGTRSWSDDNPVVMFPQRGHNQEKIFQKRVMGVVAHEMASRKFIGNRVGGKIVREAKKGGDSKKAPSFKEYTTKVKFESFQPIVFGDVVEDTAAHLPVKLTQAQSNAVVSHLPNNVHNNPQNTANNGFFEALEDSRGNMTFPRHTWSKTIENSSFVSKKAFRSKAKWVPKEKSLLQSKSKHTNSTNLDVKNVKPIGYESAHATSDTAFQRGLKQGRYYSSHNKDKSIVLEDPVHSMKQAACIGGLKDEYGKETSKRPVQAKPGRRHGRSEGFR